MRSRTARPACRIRRISGRAISRRLHILAAKEKEVALERFFCDLGHVPYGKSVPIENGVVQIPDTPGLGPAPDEELLANFKL